MHGPGFSVACASLLAPGLYPRLTIAENLERFAGFGWSLVTAAFNPERLISGTKWSAVRAPHGCSF